MGTVIGITQPPSKESAWCALFNNKFTHLLLSADCVKIKRHVALTENSPFSGASSKKAEIFFGYFDIFGHHKMNFGKVQGLYDVLFLNYHIKWGKFGPSKLGHNFLVFQVFFISGIFLL